MSPSWDTPLSVREVRRAVYLSYAQSMLGAIYLASTGGMFLIGYALKLGASNVQIGLMSSIPMFCVAAQLLASAMVEAGVSRRKLTVYGSLLNVLGWAMIIIMPYAAAQATANTKIGLLIAIISVVTIFNHIAGNARGSWVGDLVPTNIRGTFFGRAAMYGAIIGTLFTLGEGRFMDVIKEQGIEAYSILFGFGMIFGLANVWLFAKQPDVQLAREPAGESFSRLLGNTFRNKPFMLVMLFAVLWMMQSMAWTFQPTYQMRDLKMSFLGMSLINAVHTVMALVAAPFWARVVGRYGCKPALMFCAGVTTVFPPLWLLYTSQEIFYAMVLPLNIIAGFTASGIGVALATIMYKVTPNVGRSAQFAVYAILVVILPAPLPTLGGYIPQWLAAAGWPVGLRGTVALSGVFTIAATVAASFLIENGAARCRDLIRNLPRHLLSPKTLR